MPNLRVVSERSEREIKKQEAARVLRRVLLDLSENLLSVIRGTGKPERLMTQIDKVAAARNGWIEIHGTTTLNPSAVVEILTLRLPGRKDRHLYDWAMLEHRICRQALQIVASALVDRPNERNNASADLHATLGLELCRRALDDKKRRRAPKRTTRSSPRD